MNKQEVKTFMSKALSKCVDFFNDFVDGKIFSYLVNRAIMTSGRIAQSALTVSTIWISVHWSIYNYLSTMINSFVLTTLDNISIAAMTAFPEVITFIAIVTVTKYAILSIQKREQKKFDRIQLTWAILYAIPTMSFLIMTGMTYWHTSFDANDHSQMNAALMFIRLCSSYWYSTVAIIQLAMRDGRFIEEEQESTFNRVVETVQQNSLDMSKKRSRKTVEAVEMKKIDQQKSVEVPRQQTVEDVEALSTNVDAVEVEIVDNVLQFPTHVEEGKDIDEVLSTLSVEMLKVLIAPQHRMKRIELAKQCQISDVTVARKIKKLIDKLSVEKEA